MVPAESALDDPALWLALRNAPGLRRAHAHRLLERYGTPGHVLGRPAAELERMCPGSAAVALSARTPVGAARAELEAVQRSGCAVLIPPQFPELLANIPDPPLALYLRGVLPAVPAAAMVGSRRATARGKDSAHAFASALARAGGVTVSGLAYGIDAAAHAGALEAGGPTVAVLASGVDLPSPLGNRALADRILKAGGAWVSEYPLGTAALSHHFPERNRLISGLAKLTLIVEARERSGTLWTASHAIAQNRSVFAVPGPVDSDAYRGSNALLRDGAGVALEPGDLLRALGLEPAAAHAQPTDPLAARILAHLTAGPSSPDELATVLAATSSEVAATLLDLELDNQITRRGTRISLKT